MQCGVCGGENFTFRPVLWEKLINDCQFSAVEIDYFNRQQGETCDSCGSNLRSIALANALRACLGTNLLLKEIVKSSLAKNISILEINEAGTLTRYIKKFGHYVFGAYPAVDMHALPFETGTFDIVIHSDTLEHVKEPVQALSECRRVLKPSVGALCFTVPIAVGRRTLSRIGLPNSYHGSPETTSDDLLVHTEFGADAWTYAMEAGFTDISIHSVEYPAALALVARNGWGA